MAHLKKVPLQIIQGYQTPIHRQKFGSMCGYENQNIVDTILIGGTP